jgi:insecticidal toxin complex protein TccC
MDPRGLTLGSLAYCRSDEHQAAEARVTRHAYDPAGRLIASRDPRLTMANQRMVYSLSGQVLLTESVDAGWRLSLLGEAGQGLANWDSRGTERQSEYDELLRPVMITEQDQVVERFTYGGPETTDDNQCNQLTRHDDTAGTLYRPDYGLLGSPLTEVRHFLRDLDMPDWPLAVAERAALLEANGLESGWAFNALNEVIEQTDAMGNARQFKQTVAGQLKSIALGEQVLLSDIRYNAFDQVEQETAGNGVISHSTYDPQSGRLIELRAGLADAPPLQLLKYGYDPVGNILQIEDAAQPVRFFANQRIEPISQYRYDTLYQLIEASGREVKTDASHGPALPDLQNLPPDPNQIANYTQHYDYDAGGNLLEMKHVGTQPFTRIMQVAANSNRSLPEEVDVDFENGFDANGNLLQLVRGQDLSWDARNQLRHITSVQRDNGPSDDEIYIYDGGGQRCRKVSSAQTQNRTLINEVRYLPGLEIRTSADGEILHVITVNNVRLLHWPAGTSTDQLRYSLSDHLGSSTLELNNQGGLISQESYYPFGGTAWWAARGALDAKYKTVRYSGKERDASGLYYYGFRYYAPWLQRWINPDPAGDVDGLNLWVFVKNRPISLMDHLGLRPPANEEEVKLIIYHTLHGTLDRLPISLRPETHNNFSTSTHEENTNPSLERMDLVDRYESLQRRIDNESWSEKLSSFAHQSTDKLLKQSRGGTIFRHNQIIIKSLSMGASQAVLFAHGGISPHQKRFKAPYTIPNNKTLVFYSKHMMDTLNTIGLRLVTHASTYDPDAPAGRKNFHPAEFIHGGEKTHNYRISNTLEGDISPPNITYDIIHVAHGDSAMLADVFTAIQTYRPEIKIIHAIFCRAVFDRNRTRIYPRESR